MAGPSISLWDASAPEPPDCGPLDGDRTTDVAIVGGGFTGFSAALHLAEAGTDCLVLEAEKVGYGGSGRNAGLLNAGVWLPPQDVEKTLGPEAGRRLTTVLGDGPAYVFSLIEKHQIRCEAVHRGTIHAAHAPGAMADLNRRAEGWQAIGVDVTVLDKAQVGDKTGTDAFFGGLLDPRAGTINPMGYIRGLAQAAMNAGAQACDGTRVTGLKREGETWRLSTPTGDVTATHVILATNAYTDGLWPGLQRSFTPIHYFQVASEPLGEAAADILSEGQGLWDTGTIMFSLRRDQFGRIILGGMGKTIGGDTGISRTWATKTARRLFPRLGDIPWEHHWHGRIAMTGDHIPRIHKLAENLYTPICYNGRGIAPGTLFGKALAELIQGGSEADLPLPVTDPRAESFPSLRAAAIEGVFKAYRTLKSI